MDELSRVKVDLRTMAGHIQDLQASQQQTLTELDRFRDQTNNSIGMLQNSVTLAHASTTAMGGTFASLEVHLVKLFESEAEVRAMLQAHEARLEALEKQRPPAA
jgi:hypothetical protein